ncbi:hypothetical protein OH77DRAFT_1023473 [Trametes cingulata]|nr:hypothetical protein OH77DRAFT_1023473 [Trametes cingulata]
MSMSLIARGTPRAEDFDVGSQLALARVFCSRRYVSLQEATPRLFTPSIRTRCPQPKPRSTPRLPRRLAATPLLCAFFRRHPPARAHKPRHTGPTAAMLVWLDARRRPCARHLRWYVVPIRSSAYSAAVLCGATRNGTLVVPRLDLQLWASSSELLARIQVRAGRQRTPVVPLIAKPPRRLEPACTSRMSATSQRAHGGRGPRPTRNESLLPCPHTVVLL